MTVTGETISYHDKTKYQNLIYKNIDKDIDIDIEIDIDIDIKRVILRPFKPETTTINLFKKQKERKLKMFM